MWWGKREEGWARGTLCVRTHLHSHVNSLLSFHANSCSRAIIHSFPPSLSCDEHTTDSAHFFISLHMCDHRRLLSAVLAVMLCVYYTHLTASVSLSCFCLDDVPLVILFFSLLRHSFTPSWDETRVGSEGEMWVVGCHTHSHMAFSWPILRLSFVVTRQATVLVRALSRQCRSDFMVNCRPRVC